jgi:hypothetical protein
MNCWPATAEDISVIAEWDERLAEISEVAKSVGKPLVMPALSLAVMVQESVSPARASVVDFVTTPLHVKRDFELGVPTTRKDFGPSENSVFPSVSFPVRRKVLPAVAGAVYVKASVSRSPAMVSAEDGLPPTATGSWKSWRVPVVAPMSSATVYVQSTSAPARTANAALGASTPSQVSVHAAVGVPTTDSENGVDARGSPPPDSVMDTVKGSPAAPGASSVNSMFAPLML